MTAVEYLTRFLLERLGDPDMRRPSPDSARVLQAHWEIVRAYQQQADSDDFAKGRADGLRQVVEKLARAHGWRG